MYIIYKTHLEKKSLKGCIIRNYLRKLFFLHEKETKCPLPYL